MAQWKWNAKLIQETFGEEDGNNIIRIPLSIYQRKDKLISRYTKSSNYTVKSGYVIVHQEEKKATIKKKEESETSVENSKRRAWKELWGSNVKHKLKHFFWKYLYNSLPVNKIINKKTGISDRIYRGCGEEVETLEHIFFKCYIAKRI